MLFALAIAPPAFADSSLTATYQGRAIRFTHLSSRAGAPAIGVNDPGFTTLLNDAGALLTWKPGERFVLITTSVPLVVSFAIGDRRYDAGPISLQASFAPFLVGDEAYLPLREVLRVLDLALREENGVAVLQPQLAALDVRQDGSRVTVFAHGGATLHARVAQESSASITYAFDGVGTTLAGTRQVGSGGIASITIANAGTLREPSTLVTVQFESGTIAEAPQNTDGRDVLLAFDTPASASPPQTAAEEASPTPEPPDTTPASGAGSAPASGPATVTGVTVEPAADGVSVAIAIAGSATYEWHRLREPDNRFWVDIENAQLQGPPIDQSAPAPLLSVRVRQVDPTTVRVALSLSGPKSIAFTSSAGGLGLAIGTQDVADEQRSGSGGVGGASAVVAAAPLEQSEPGTGSSDDSSWKFGPRSGYVATNPRLIVIDPGHGGSDVGTMHGGLSEKELTLDMAKRLRAILIGRGWEVKMTRESDVDVYAPNDSPHDELQARDDIANKAGARLFVSIHVNAFINSGPYGTTTYISKPDDVAFAHFVESHLAADGTKDDGIIKSHLYVTLHARMPAVLIETAFLTNPGDYALLTSAAWRQKVAQEIADGIGQYAQRYPVPNQPAQ